MKSTLRKYCIIFTTIFSLVLSVFVLNAQTINTTYPSAPGSVNAVVSDANYTYVGGNFTSIGSLPIKYLARIKRSDNTVDASWTPNPGNVTSGGAAVNSLALSGTDLYVSGDFTTIGGQAINKLARISTIGSGTADPTWQPNINSRVAQMIVSGTDLFIAGIFSSIGGQPYSPLAKISTLGTGLPDPNWRPNPNLQVISIALAGNNLYVGGAFTSIGGLTQNGIARISTTGTGDADPNWMPVITKNTGSPSIHTIKISDTGSELYIGGFFNQVGGLVRNNIAKISANGNGEVDVNWNPNANSLVNRLFVSGNNAYAAGNFFNIGGIPRSRFAKLDANGTGAVDPNWNSPFTTVNFVFAFEKVGSDLLIGGTFAVNSNTIPVQYNLLQLVGENPTAAATATITAPVTSVCAGSPAELTANIGDSYQWYKDGVAIASATAQIYNATASGSYTVAVTMGGSTATSTATVINVTPAPVVTVTASGPTAICGGSPLVLTASTPNGGFWSTGEFGNTITVYGAGSYTVQISSEDGLCSVTSEPLVVTENPTPEITDIINDGRRDICANTTMVLRNDTPGGVWSSGNTAVATVDANGTVHGISEGNAMITYTITNESGCSNYVTYEVMILPLPISGPIDGPTAICLNTPTTLNLTVSNGRDDRAEWTTSNANIVAITGSFPSGAEITGISAGTATINYYFTNTYGCRALVSTAQITVNPAPVAPTGTNQLRCSNGAVTLNATVAEGEQINWYDAATEGNLLFTGSAFTTPSLTATTTYYAEAINTTTGCISATRTAITTTIGTLPVVANITGLNAVCETGTIQLSNSTTGGVWSSDNTALATVDATGKLTGVQAGTVVIAYTVTNATGCSTTKTYTVTVKLKPAKPVIIGETTGCLGSTIVLTAISDAPNPSFRWCNTPTASPIRTFVLDYSPSLCVNVTSNGCSSDQIIVPVTTKPLPAAVITAVGATSFCAGSSVQLNASTATGNTYQWKLNGNNISGATAATYVASATGNYSVAVTAINTCTTNSSAITVNATDNVAPGSTAIQFAAPAAILSNVAEAVQYNLAYELNVPENGNYSVVNPTYAVNNAAQLQNIPLDRIAYYMQLNDKWVWVSMDAFTNNVSLTGIPVTNTIWQQKVNNMNVFSSANAGVTNGTGIATGSIEMWKFNYLPNVGLGLAGASSSNYDYDDLPQSGVGNHGSFQVHNYGIGQTIFGYSRFGQNGRGEIGIGNNTVANGGNGGHPDWTFNTNANIYSTKKIYVFVKPKAQVIAKDATIYLDANGVAVVPVSAVNNGVVDNCSAVTATVSPAQFTGANLGVNTVTVTLTDASGNTNSGTSVVTVVDNIKPVITCTNNLDVYATSTAGAIINYAIPTATDNSGNVTLTMVSGIASGSQFPNGTTTVTYKATDASGNFVECSFTVTVSGVAPVVIAPANITVNNTPGTCGSAVTFAATETTAIPASTITYSIAPGSIFAVGTTTVTATATNAVGSNAATFTVTVIDTENPTILAPVAVGVPTDLNSNTASNVVLGAPVTSDNCAIASVSNNAPTVYPIGTTTVTWTVIDIHGNRSTASQQVTVSDQQAPTVHTQNLTIYLNASGTATITATQINNGSTDNTTIATYELNNNSFSCATAGEQMVVLTVTDIYGNAASANAMVTILDAIAPSVTAVANQTFCANVSGSNYTIAALSATDNCSIASITYTVTGATNRTGVGYDASGAFSIGTSVIKWTVTDASGNATSSSTTVKVNPLPVATITATTADALCNQFVLTANSAAAYQWMFNNATTGSLPTITLGLTNADGVYSLVITDANGCKSATAVTYKYQKQNLVNSYTILASKEVKLGKYNTVASGSVGITSAKGEAEFKKYSSVNGVGSFVKSPKIKKDGTGVLIANSINGIASVTLPTMQLNNANTQNLASYTVSQNATQTLSANYKTLTIKKGANVTVSGNSFGKIKMEEGASIRFTASTINIEELNIDKGAKNGRYSFVRFAPNSSIRVTDKVTIGSRVRVNEENYKVTFYLKQAQYSKGHDDDDDDDDHDNDGAEFSVKGSDTRVIANVMMPGGKLKVISNESDDDKDRCSHTAHSAKDCRHKNHEHNDCNHASHSPASCNDDVYMTGLFVAAEVESEGNTVVWNSYDCSAPASISINNDVSALVTDEVKFTPVVEQAELNVLVMPNPSTTYFTLKLESKNEAPVNIRVVDAVGRLVDVKTKMGANSTFQIGHNYSSGTYFVELLQGNKRKVIQLIKTRG